MLQVVREKTLLTLRLINKSYKYLTTITTFNKVIIWAKNKIKGVARLFCSCNKIIMKRFIVYYKNMNDERVSIDVFAFDLVDAEREVRIRRNDIKVILSIWKVK